jgi:LmbE family N-acetylglucosaminyl deacetylase
MNMNWTYISPHLDDAVFSCGGLIWEQTKQGKQVSIWTIFAGDPPEGPLSDFAEILQIRWQGGRDAISRRRQEDNLACMQIGASCRHFPFPDCIYRWIHRLPDDLEVEQNMNPLGKTEFFYPSHESLFGPIHSEEVGLAEPLSQLLAKLLPEETELVCPLALGNHVDHQLTRAAVEKLERRTWFYADYPYATDSLGQIEIMEKSGWRNQLFPISEGGMKAWKEAVAAYRSQISSFWDGSEAMKKELEDYREFFGGVMLWQPKNKHMK